MAEPFKNLAWDDLRLIKSIAEVRNLPAAADLLGVNHSTVVAVSDNSRRRWTPSSSNAIAPATPSPP